QADFASTPAGQRNASGPRGTDPKGYVNPGRVQRLLGLIDGVALLTSLVVLFNVALQFLSKDAALIAAALVAAEVTYICVIALRWIRSYDTDFLTNIVHGALAAMAVTTLVGGSAVLFTDVFLFPLPPGSGLAWLAAMAIYFLASRLAVGSWAKPLAAAGAFRQRIAIVGAGRHAEAAIDALHGSADIDVDIIGLFDNRSRSPETVRGYKKIGRIADLSEYVSDNRVDLVIIAIPMTAHSRLMQLLPRLWKLPVDIRICGQAIDMKLSPRAYTFLGRLPLLTVFSRPFDDAALRNKKILDRLIAIGLIGLLSPIFAAVALAVRLTGQGPLLVAETCTGFDGRPINLWRFRTRCHTDQDNAEQPLTALGRFLQRASLHNMPELFNVIKGDLSIVGPAIHAASDDGAMSLYEKAADSYCLRHGIKPGLTGWAQIHGFGGELDTPEKIENRVKYDLEYVDRFSWLFDLRILAKTPFARLRSKSPQYIV
ncbi:MAG: sugar transferase, partial [Aestuariivirgaceae bacterium]